MEKRYGKLSSAGSNLPPIGLCYLAAVVKNIGVKAFIIDSPALNYDVTETVNEIVGINPDMVGITAATISISNAADVAKELKKRKYNKPIILGGPHVTALPEKTLEVYPEFDYAVIGEGEETIADIIQNGINKGKLCDIKGIAIREGNGVIRTERRPFVKNLDSMPLPAWDLLPNFPNNYSQSAQKSNRSPSASLITSRGCYGQCTFCDTSVFGSRIRAHSAKYVIEMIKNLIDKYKIKEITFCDDNFIVNNNRLKSICEYMMQSEVDLSWSCCARIDTVKNKEKLEMMKDAGCWQISYGIESGNQKILDEEKKNVKIDKICEVVDWTDKAGIKVKGFFMMGHPLETVETMRETIRLAKRLPLSYAHVTYVTPLPGTELYKTAINYGEFDGDWTKMNMWTPIFIPFGLTEKEMEKYKKRFFVEFYFRPRIIFNYMKKIRSINQVKGIFRGFYAIVNSIVNNR
ncbi:B12-binding domain-containing radical SAM protein [Prosthecochloris sp. SCSIO W1103]|uniref:B12-binding domain-containing radical SAM protein n=1 Tax=Prosthecochloris sp. SCSIO W1103 TaxID=2992244 RepID=UPI00223E0190|nr:radical SAM protein [Prosthecochloris sp. SCSIO W1103]UZJ38150.1 B12-binding domain-containing radical SAM protein [Prosthecochloris sp. SCSIO W1103]